MLRSNIIHFTIVASLMATTGTNLALAQTATTQGPVGQDQINTLKMEVQALVDKELYSKAFPIMQKLVQTGDAHTIYNMAAMYNEGLGVAKNPQKAWSLYLEAAEKDYTPAQTFVAENYAVGKLTAKDLVKSAYWCQRAADLNDPLGMICLAYAHKTGSGVPKNDALSIDWLKRAVALKDATAMSMLGRLYINGDGVAKSPSIAIKYFLAAAQEGDAVSMFELGDIYRAGELGTPDLARARHWYGEAAKLGYVGGQVNFAIMLAQGIGGPKEPVRAFQMLLLAAQAGDSFAQSNLATMYAKGEGVTANIFAAHQWRYEALRNPNLDEMLRAKIEFDLVCECEKISKEDKARARASSPLQQEQKILIE